MTTWSDEQLADYECALETIGNVIALKARDLAEERTKLTPDAGQLTKLRQQQAELADERSRLRIADHDAVARTIEQYGKIVRESALKKEPFRSPREHLGPDARGVVQITPSTARANWLYPAGGS